MNMNTRGLMPLSRPRRRVRVLLAGLCLAASAPSFADARAALSDADFIDLCASGAPEAIRQALAEGANPNAKNRYGITALMYAANNNRDAGALRALLEGGADVKAKDEDGATALMGAALHGEGDNADKLGALIAAGAEVNAQKTGNWEKGWTALMLAARFGKEAVVSALLSAGTDRKAQDAAGRDALWHARHPEKDTDAEACIRLLEDESGEAPDPGAASSLKDAP